jgi:3-deoxy-D-manno-octulosonic-acid transferase
MKRVSLGLALRHVSAWFMQPFVKNALLRKLEAEEYRADLVDQLLGANFPKRDAGTLIWLHSRTLVQCADFGEVVAHYDDRDDVSFLWTTEEDDPSGQFEQTGTHQHLPLDHPSFTTKFLQKWQPDALVWVSDSIRPVLMRTVARLGIPAIYANAGMSRAQGRRFVWFPNFTGVYLSSFDRILAKTDESARRLRRANAPRAKLEVLGVMHAGARALPHDEKERSRLAGYLNNRPVWLAAHVAVGEVAAIAKAQRRVSRMAQGLMMILHVADKAQAMTAIRKLSNLGLRARLQGKDAVPEADTDIYIVFGGENLGLWYRLAPVCFLGNSLIDAGGSDPFEAAALGSAILHGPHTDSFQNSYDRLTDAGAARMVYNSEMLATALSETLSPDRAAEMAHAAWEVSSAGAEVNDRVIELLDGYLNKGDTDAAA